MRKRLRLAGALLLVLGCGLLMEGLVIAESALPGENTNSSAVSQSKNVNARRGRRGRRQPRRRGRRGKSNKKVG